MIPFKSSQIFYTDKGRGNTIVLLHGYLETNHIWDGFADELAKNFRIIAIDIPGQNAFARHEFVPVRAVLLLQPLGHLGEVRAIPAVRSLVCCGHVIGSLHSSN